MTELKAEGFLFPIRAAPGKMLQTPYTSDVSVVIQFGKAFTKLGFSGEDQPRAIIPTPMLQLSRTNPSADATLLATTLTVSEWSGVLHKLLQQVFFQQLRVSPSDHPVMLIEDDLTPTVFREVVTTVLFEHLCVPRICYVSDAVAPLYLCGVTTGIIVDIGYLETRITPVCFGVPLYRARQTLAIGSHTVNENLRASLLKDALTPSASACAQAHQIESLDISKLENLKVQCCYVRFEIPDESRTQLPQESASRDEDTVPSTFRFLSDKSLVYNRNVEVPVYVAPESRWGPCECFFEASPSLPVTLCDGVIAALELCPSDVKRYVVENVLLCGGSADLRGFEQRFAIELRDRIEKHPGLSTPLLLQRLSLGTPKAPAFIRQWIGGAVCSAATVNLQNVPNTITAREWETSRTLPDWVIPLALKLREADTSKEILTAATRPPFIEDVLDV